MKFTLLVTLCAVAISTGIYCCEGRTKKSLHQNPNRFTPQQILEENEQEELALIHALLSSGKKESKPTDTTLEKAKEITDERELTCLSKELSKMQKTDEALEASSKNLQKLKNDLAKLNALSEESYSDHTQLINENCRLKMEILDLKATIKKLQNPHVPASDSKQ